MCFARKPLMRFGWIGLNQTCSIGRKKMSKTGSFIGLTCLNMQIKFEKSLSMDQNFQGNNWNRVVYSLISSFLSEDKFAHCLVNITFIYFPFEFTICFCSLSRLTSRSYLSSRIKVIDRLDRQKIVLNALYLIIFHNNTKTYSWNCLLIVFLAIVLISLVFIIKRWLRTLELLARIEDRVQCSRGYRQLRSSNYSSLDSRTSSCNNKYNVYKPTRMSETLKERELRLVEEIAFTRERLEYCERLLHELPDENLPFDRSKLQKFLQLTFEMELNFYTGERMGLEREIMVRIWCNKYCNGLSISVLLFIHNPLDARKEKTEAQKKGSCKRWAVLREHQIASNSKSKPDEWGSWVL